MRRVSFVVGFLLACNTGTSAVPAPAPARPVTSPSPTPLAPAPTPAGCEATVLELVVEAPADRALLVDSPTLPLARRELAAGAVLRERFDPARPGVHLIQLRDPGQPDLVDHRPLVLLDGEHHHYTDNAGTPRHRIERCAQGVLAPLYDSDAAPATGWDTLLVSADGATFARLSPYTRHAARGIELALIDPTRGPRRMSLADAPEADPAPLAAASEVLVRDGFKRVDPKQLRPVRDVAHRDQAIHVRWRDRIGSVPLPAAPDPALPGDCCAWTSPHALALPDAQAVLVDLQFACNADNPRCDTRFHDASWVVVPLTADAPADARYRPVSESVARALADALGPARGLAYPPQIGPFGPSPDGVFVLSKDDAGRLGGYVEAEFEGAVTRLPLPDLMWSMSEIQAVLFEDVDGDGRDDAIILVHAMTGIGPTGAEEFFGAHAIGWNGTEFVNLLDVERKLEKAKSVAAVRKLLHPPPPKPR